MATILAIYLIALRFDPAVVGILLSLLLVASAAITIWTVRRADVFGRRRSLALFGVLMVVSGILLSAPIHPFIAILVVALGTISPTGTESGPFLSVEQALLPQTCSSAERTAVFSVYNLIGVLCAAGGGLLAGGAFFFVPPTAADPLLPFRVVFLVFALLGVLAIVLSLAISRQVEVAGGASARPQELAPESARRVRSLAGLFALDSFAGGFVVQSLVAYWFFTRFGADPQTLGTLFFVAGLCTAVSMLAAPVVARRIGLVRTMVFTHLPSSVFLILVGFAPTLLIGVALFLSRMSLSQMDVPTRQSFIASIVAPEERTAAAGVTNIARNVAQAASPTAASWAIGAGGALLAAPFVIGGGLKVVYDLALYWRFRNVVPEGEADSASGGRQPAINPKRLP